MKSQSEKETMMPPANLIEAQNISNSDLTTTICEVKIKFNKLNLIQLCWVF
jgi:hypothetical protein